jgi:hypothetical protein
LSNANAGKNEYEKSNENAPHIAPLWLKLNCGI